MSSPYIGFGGLVSLGKESTYGTAVTTDKVLPVLSCTLEVTQEPVVLEYLGYAYNHVHHNPRETAIVAHDVAGKIETHLTYDTTPIGLLLEAMFGTFATTGSGPYVHTYLLRTQGVMNGLTARQLVGRSASESVTDKERVWTGLVVTSWEIMAKAREPVRLSLDLIGRTGTAIGAVTGTPSVAALGETILAHHLTAITWDSTTYVCTDVTIRCNHKLERRPVVGSLYTDKPAPSGYQEIEIIATIQVADDDFLVDLLAGTSGDLACTFTGSGGSLVITGHNCQLRTAPMPVNNHGVITAVLTWRCLADSSDRGLAAVLTNANTAPYA